MLRALCGVWYGRSVCCTVLRVRYALSGTEIGYAATRRWLQTRRPKVLVAIVLRAKCGTDIAYAATNSRGDVRY
eukprot:1166244-Rhodomonas_salina.1